MENIHGNVILKQFYKFENNVIKNLENDDYNKIVFDEGKIRMRFPLYKNGLYSDIIEYSTPCSSS